MLLERFFERRGTVLIANPRDPVLADWWGMSGMTDAGISVTPETALRMTAVFACVRILSESLASIAINMYRWLPKGGKELATNHPLFKLLQFGPNEDQTTFDWLEMMIGHMALRGNAYNQLLYPKAGPLAGMTPLHPDRVRPFRDKRGKKWFDYSPASGDHEILSTDEVLQFDIFSDGLKGRSVIEYNREAVGLGLAAEQFGARFFQNGATMSGTLSAEGTLSDKARKNLEESLRNRHQGSSNSNRYMILEEGMKWTQLGVPPDQAQFLETRKFQISEVARMFRVPPHMLADLDRATFSNIEQMSLEFVMYSLMPWMTRIEQRMNKSLLTDNGKKSFFVKFNTNSFLRGDSAARGEFHTKLFNIGAVSPNEVREAEDMNPVTGGDKRYIQINMAEISEDGTPNTSAATTQAARSYQVIFRSAWQRIVTAEVRGLRRALDNTDMAEFGASANELLHELKPLMRRSLTPVIESLRQAIDTRNALKTSEYVESIIEEHLRELAQSLVDVSGEGREGILRMLDELDLDGVSDIVERETSRAVLWAAGSLQ